METYSYSKVKLFYSCKYAYYTRYYEKPDNLLTHGTSEFGSFMHEILEKYEKNQLEIYEMLPYYIDHYKENVTSTFVLNMSEDFSKDFSDMYYVSGLKYLEQFNGFPQFKIVEAEKEFNLCVEGKFKFNGKIDLIAYDENGDLIILDHKSKSRFKSKKEQKEYAKQMYLYAYAVNEIYHKMPTKLYFNMFRTGEIIEIPFKQADYDEAYNWLVSSVAEIESTFDFQPQEEPDKFYCRNFCPIRDNCKY